MKAEIKRNGELHIYPENEVESYALKKWCDVNMPSTLALIIHSELLTEIQKNDD